MNPVLQASPSASLKDILGNPILLPIIFDHLPFQSVMQLRLVNKTWNKAAIPALKKHAGYLFLNVYYDQDCKPKYEPHLMRLIKLVDCVISSTNFPFTKLNIDLTRLINGHAWNVLIRSVAPFLTHLDLSVSRSYTDNLELDPSLPEDIHFPKLKDLKMFFDDKEPDDVQSTFLEKIIAAAPILKSLEVLYAGRTVLQQLTHHPNLHLDKLRLQFGHEFFGKFQNHEHVVNLLENQKDTLQKLSLSAPRVRRFVEVNMVSYSLPKVKALHLCDNNEVEEDQPKENENVWLHPLEYVKKFPNLEEVSLESSPSDEDYTVFFTDYTGVPSTSVTHLQLGGLHKMECQKGTVIYIPEIFPNLSILEVGTSFTIVVELVARLEHLETVIVRCGCGDSADQIFGGLDLKDWHKYGRISLKPFGVIRDFRGMMDKAPFSAWHKIRTLKFEFFSNSRFPLSEATCRLVLLKMRNLKEIHFTGRKPSEDEISVAVMKQMEAKFEVFSPLDDE